MAGDRFRPDLLAFWFPKWGDPTRVNYPEIDVARITETGVLSKGDVLSFYSSVLSMITSDGQLVWSRYNAMLAANTFIGALLGILLTKQGWTWVDGLLSSLTSVFGLALSLQWRGLTMRGWQLQHYWVQYAEAFKFWPGFENPLEPYVRWARDHNTGEGVHDWIARYAHGAIRIFIIGFASALLVSIGLVIGTIWG